MKEFEGAEVFPDFSNELQRIQQGEYALTASKLGVDLYPNSGELLFNLGFFLLLSEQTEQGRASARRLVGNYERPAQRSYRVGDRWNHLAQQERRSV
jgi:hypothetical protein